MREAAAARPLSTRRFLQAESPRFDERTGELIWVDMRAGAFFVGRMDAGSLAIDLEVDVGPVGCAAPLFEARDGWIVAGGDRLLWVRRDGTSDVVLTGLTPDASRTLNDGVAAPDGSFWVGSQTSPRRAEGTLFRIDGDLSVAKVRHGVTVSNGIDFSSDGRHCYYLDTLPARTIECLSVRAGRIVASAPVVAVDGGNPDGLVLDAGGSVWVAVWGAGEVRRYAPDGRLLDSVAVPTPLVSAVTLADRLLVITTACGPEDDDSAAGRIYGTQVDTPGHAVRTFRPGAGVLRRQAACSSR